MATQAEVTSRVIDGIEYPPAGTYALDTAHTRLGFAVRHMAVSKVRGGLNTFEGTVVIGEDPLDSTVEVAIDATSVDTRDEARDNHLRSNDFFDVENHPKWTFVSTAIRPTGDDQWEVDGELTIRGVTRPVTLHTVFEGVVRDPYGNVRLGFTATTSIDRNEFGVAFNAVMEAGGVVVAKKVDIEIEAEAVLQA
ncbi:MAG: YceI family protein [Acidimicrobiales bacterium]